jgi:hypothetical protein
MASRKTPKTRPKHWSSKEPHSPVLAVNAQTRSQCTSQPGGLTCDHHAEDFLVEPRNLRLRLA